MTALRCVAGVEPLAYLRVQPGHSVRFLLAQSAPIGFRENDGQRAGLTRFKAYHESASYA